MLKGVTLDVERHEVVCLIGASGSGKFTLLRCVNALEDISSGEIPGRLVIVTGADPVGPHLSRALVGGVRWWRGSERFAEVLLLGWTLCSR